MRSVVLPLGLALGCGGPKAPEPIEPTHNPPAPAPAPTPPPALPAWDDVPSPHPPGATNPPSPVLLVTPQGACFKQWVSPFLPPEQHQDRVVDACPSADERVGDCGTAVQCPPTAAGLLEAWKTEHAE